jgi:NADPH:quinone reductase-like Zn-dependent oxidoreductase
MRAVVCTAYGDPDVLEPREIAKPTPSDHQVRIKVFATTATAACGMMRRADSVMARLILGLRRPRARYQVMGIELAGEIDQVGRKVTRFRPGQRVFGFAGFSAGAYAQFCCVPEGASLEIMPAKLSFEEAASLVDGATTALYFLRDRAGIRAGDRVLVIGASGSIGTAAIQLARHFGAEVTGVCSGSNADLVTSLGARRVIDYTTEDFVQRGETYDIVFDAVGKSSYARCRRVLARGGRYLVTVGGLPHYLLDAWSRLFGSKKFVYGMSIDKRNALRLVAELSEAGRLEPVVDRRYDLDQMADAHGYVDTGRKRGNVVVSVRHG